MEKIAFWHKSAAIAFRGMISIIYIYTYIYNIIYIYYILYIYIYYICIYIIDIIKYVTFIGLFPLVPMKHPEIPWLSGTLLAP